MKQVSEIGKKMLAFQEKLAAERKYAPVEIDLFVGDVREKYRAALPEWCKEGGDLQTPLYTLDDTQIATGYQRIVIGDYGAFVEISSEQIRKEALRCKPGQEYRFAEERFAANVKYLWLTAKDRSDCKIYFQKKGVNYADYIPGMFYISPYEIYVEETQL